MTDDDVQRMIDRAIEAERQRIVAALERATEDHPDAAEALHAVAWAVSTSNGATP